MAQVVRKRKVDFPRQKARGKKSDKQAAEAPNLRKESYTLFFFFLGLFLALSLYSHVAALSPIPGEAVTQPNMLGPVGGLVSRLLFALLGWCSFIVALWAFLAARKVWIAGAAESESSLGKSISSVVGSIFMVSAAAAIVTVFAGVRGGGSIGRQIVDAVSPFLGTVGTVLFASAIFLLATGVATGIGVGRIVGSGTSVSRYIGSLLADAWFFCCRILGFIFGVSARTVWRATTQSFSVFAHSASNLFHRPKDKHYEVKKKKGRAQDNDDEEVFELGEDQYSHKKIVKRIAAPAVLPKLQAEEEEGEDDDSEEYDEEEGEEEESEDHEPREIKVSRRNTVSKEARGALKRLMKAQKKKRKEGPKGKSKEDDRSFELPPLDLLVAGEGQTAGAPDDKELVHNSERLEKTLTDFKIGGEIVEVQPGPVITLYEFQPAAGVKVQRIITLADDLALALKVASVRVYAPVPGKGTVGIEVPNSYREVVRLRDVLASNEFGQAESPLTLAIGKDTFGEPYVADLARMPHLLIAGATGTGKSVCLNSMLTSLLYRNTPEQLRFIMIDPKMLELSLYEDIPHLKAPVVTNPKRARGVLWWAVEEMERRYRLMKEMGVRNLDGYNRLVAQGQPPEDRGADDEDKLIELHEKDVVATGAVDSGLERDNVGVDALGRKILRAAKAREPLPRIVIVVDELADLMLTVGREVEELFTRLAQKARASGIHLILATQRPSVNVITGLIKANFPARISFKVASRIDARTVLDTSGAEKLLGQGDMLYLSPGFGRPKRLHAAFVSDKEVQDVVTMLKKQGPPDYDADIEAMIERMEQAERGTGGDGSVENEFDPLYDQAVALVVEKGQASTSMVQRAFRIGYNRAARMLETMEREGVVGPADGAKPRSVFSVVGSGAEE